MKAKDVQIGGTYIAKVSGKLTSVTLLQTSPYGGWEAFNKATGKRVRIRTAARLRKPVVNQSKPTYVCCPHCALVVTSLEPTSGVCPQCTEDAYDAYCPR
jgi:hypothetical protein